MFDKYQIVILQAAAQTAETHDVRHRTVAAGSACAEAYKNLLEQVNIVSPYSYCFTYVTTGKNFTYWDREVETNSADPDQTALKRAV